MARREMTSFHRLDWRDGWISAKTGTASSPEQIVRGSFRNSGYEPGEITHGLPQPALPAGLT
jgi:hypothetical protein